MALDDGSDPGADTLADSATDPVADDLATAPGSACFTAIDATALATWSGVLADYPNIWTAGTGCGTASGAEAWFTATVPPSWTFSVTETGTSIAMDVANGP